MQTRKSLAVVLLFSLALQARPARAADAPPTDRYAPQTLLSYRAADGSTVPVKTPGDWARRREQILSAMQQVMGPLPDRSKLPPLDVELLGEEKGDGFVRQSIRYTSEIDPKSGKPERVPAYLFLPTDLKPGERRPAVLALHPTSPLGKAAITGAGKPDREYGLELAQHGYVVLCPDYPSFGDYSKDFAASAHPSGSMQGIVNHLRAVDLLVARPEVDAERIAAVGHSLGGHNTLFAAAFDTRIKAVVTSCGWTVFENYYGGNLKGWTSDRYMPRVRTEYGLSPAKMPFDFHEVLAAIAPRPVLSVSPTKDANFDVAGVDKGIAAAKPVFELLGAIDALQVVRPDGGHDFAPDMREKAYAFLDTSLKFDGASRAGRANGRGRSPVAVPVIAARDGATPASKPAAIPATKPATHDLAAELPRIPARSLADALKAIHTLPGFKPQLVAAEPLVFSPVAIDFDENGRAFVCEMVDYPFPSKEPLGRIAVLEDTNDDGVYDKRTVLADKLHWPTAVVCFDGGCFVGSAPDIFYLKDTDGDGKADVRKTVFTGFGKQNVQGLLNSFRWGIDNRIQGATGTNGGKVRRADLPENDPKNVAVSLNGRDFSFDPRLLDLRAESGGAQHGMSFDDFGRKYVSSNSDHIQQVVYDDRYAAANPNVQLPPARVSIAADGPQAPVFRISPVEPWRIVRTRMRVSGESKGLIEGGGTPAGYFTGATGVTIYRGDAFPPEYKGQAFIGDVGSNLVHRKVLKPTGGVLMSAERVDEGKEFLASEDIWFRPAQFANAPDGTLYILDVCREVIEHPDSLPESIKAHLDLTSGRDRGRIYRVVPDGYEQKPVPKLGKLSTAELVKTLESPNGWHRDAASRLLYERQDKSAVEALTRFSSKESPVSYVHALYALAGLADDDTLKRQVSSLAMSFNGKVVPRRHEPLIHAERLSERWQVSLVWPTWSGSDPAARQATCELALQSALSRTVTSARVADAGADLSLANVLRDAGQDPYVRASALAAANRPADVYSRLSSDAAWRKTSNGQQVLRALARLTVLSGDAEEVAKVTKSLDTTLHDDREVSDDVVAGLLEGLAKGGPKLRQQVVQGRVATAMAELVAKSKLDAVKADLSAAERADAVRTLGFATFADVRDTLVGLLGGNQPQEVQLAAIAALDAFADEPAVGELLTKAWPRLTPRVRTTALDAILSRPARAVAFLSAIEAEKIPAVDLDAARLKRLLASKDAKVRELAATVAKRSALSPRADVVAAYRKSLEIKGDAKVGKALFAHSCATCHKLEGVGVEIGPNLVSMQARGSEAVMVNVLDPNREVNGQFVEYVVETKDGRSLSGLLASETAAAVTLLKPGGQTETVARTDIEKLRGSGLSLMPEGFEKQLTPQQMADLIAYVMGAK